MALTAQAGIFGFGPQFVMGTKAATYYRHKATLIDLGVNDDVRVGPQEIGSGPFPTFPYKAGYVVGGGVEIQPRLEDTLGWLLYSALGSVATTNPETGVYSHEFTPDTNDLSMVKWLTLRKYIPKKDGSEATDMGEEYVDCKPVGLALTLANDAPVTARWDFMGRTYQLQPNIGAASPQTPTALARASGVVTVTAAAHGFLVGDLVHITGVTPTTFNGDFYISSVLAGSFTYLQAGTDESSTVHGTASVGEAWTWDNTYEDWGSIPVGCELGGFIKFSGGGLTDEELPVVGGRINFANQNLDIRQEKVYGSPGLEDVTIITRQITYDVTIKWNNPKIYRAVLAGNINAGEWSSKVLTGSLDIAMVGSGLIGATQVKHQLNCTAQEVMFQMNTPIQLAGGQAVIMRFTGTALEPSSGDYATFTLKNGATEYVWPTS